MDHPHRTPESETTATEAVLRGITERSGRDIADLPPLYESIDPEVLNRIVSNSEMCHVSFEYAGYDVTVVGDDDVIVDETEWMTDDVNGRR